MEGFPQTDFDKLKLQMQTEGFQYVGIESIYEDKFSTENKKFESEQVQTKEDILGKYQDKATEVKLLPVPRTKIENSQFYVFVK